MSVHSFKIVVESRWSFWIRGESDLWSTSFSTRKGRGLFANLRQDLMVVRSWNPCSFKFAFNARFHARISRHATYMLKHRTVCKKALFLDREIFWQYLLKCFYCNMFSFFSVFCGFQFLIPTIHSPIIFQGYREREHDKSIFCLTQGNTFKIQYFTSKFYVLKIVLLFSFGAKCRYNIAILPILITSVIIKKS